MDLIEKLTVLTDSAKYDVACTSSGSERGGHKAALGNTVSGGICHSFSADGRCISLLKVLMSNCCIYDCKYCVNRRSNDVARASFTPEELAELTIGFYRRNYIEGLFLSSAVIRNPDYTMEQMLRVVSLLRNTYNFRGYIHAKAIPGASQDLIDRMGMAVDRMSINLELPSEQSLSALAPDKSKTSILGPMGVIRDRILQNKEEMTVYRHAPRFAPAGQSTQMIIGATPDTDYQIVRLAESLYKKYTLKRVFYSAYVAVGDHALLPKNQPTPLLREHRLYQADWLLRFYGFRADELLSEKSPSLDPMLDPKCNWALNNLDAFPVEVNRAELSVLLRVPGIGVKSAQRIVAARRSAKLTFSDLKKIGVVMKRAIYFITCGGKYADGIKFDRPYIYDNLTYDYRRKPDPLRGEATQLSLFDSPDMLPDKTEVFSCITGQI